MSRSVLGGNSPRRARLHKEKTPGAFTAGDVSNLVAEHSFNELKKLLRRAGGDYRFGMSAEDVARAFLVAQGGLRSDAESPTTEDTSSE